MLKEAEVISFIKDLELVSELDVKLIKSNDSRQKAKHKDSLNVNLNNDYSTYWTQDITRLKIEWDNEKLDFWIEEEKELFTPSQRSKGKQWHISFYLKIAARSIEGKTNIILIDEPGLFLHASAQKDIYHRVLTTSKAIDVQVIFTTHSPYLLRSSELQRIRLIEKSTIKSGTKVSNKVYARADKETLTPILTAIGVELNQGIQNIGQINNVVVEGPSDVFYCNGFAKLLLIKNINFIYGGGSGNLGNIGTILTGWGCNVVYLFDNDQGKTNGSKTLKKTWLVDETRILSVSKLTGAIEDIFSIEEFAEFILDDKNEEIGLSNTDYTKKKGLDKVLLSRQFLTRVDNHQVKLSDATMKKIELLFEELISLFATTSFS